MQQSIAPGKYLGHQASIWAPRQVSGPPAFRVHTMLHHQRRTAGKKRRLAGYQCGHFYLKHQRLAKKCGCKAAPLSFRSGDARKQLYCTGLCQCGGKCDN